MATRTEESYHYYFVTKNGVTTIVKKSFALPMSIYGKRGYEEMTDEQVEFYLAHPDASIEEIRNCALNEQPQTDPEIESAKASALFEINTIFSASIKVSDRHWEAAVTDFLKQNNAITLASVPDLMDNSESREVIANFATSYIQCKQLLDQAKTEIAAATTADQVWDIIDDYRSRFSQL